MNDILHDDRRASSIHALAIAYYDSAAFKAPNPDSTQGVYRNIIERFCRETDKRGPDLRG